MEVNQEVNHVSKFTVPLSWLQVSNCIQ